MANVRGYDYQPNSTVEYKRFNSDYYTGADVRIYFGDIWVDEINNLQFTLQENVAPIFGYASYTWDRVARGTRQIQGSFTINFRESYYLHSVIDRLDSNMEGDKDNAKYKFNYDQFTKDATIEHLMTNVDGKNFDVIADQFEKSLWGGDGNGDATAALNTRSKGPFFNGKTGTSGFNILVSYGPFNAPNGRTTPETMHSLTGVHLTGVSQIVGLDGRPIEEQYSFIAKDLDSKVN